MPITNKNIAIEESATVTARVATVQIPRGSTNEQQELLTLGDPSDSLGMARILNSTPASTEYALAVREVAQSTGAFSISSIAGVTRIAPNDTNFASSAGFHFNSSGELNVNVASPSTVITISTVQGIVTVRPSDTNFASSAGFHFDSSGALNIKDQTAPSTGPIAISSIAGQTRVAPTDTNWASSAGFHFDSSGGLQIAGNITSSTQVAVSSVAGRVATAPNDTSWASSAGFHFNSSGELNVNAAFSGSTDVRISAVATSTTAQNSSNYLPVRLTDGSSFFSAQDVTDGSTNSTLVGGLIGFNNSSGNTMRIVGSSSPLPVNLQAAVSTLWASSAGFHFDSSGGLQIAGNITGSTDIRVTAIAVSTFAQNSSAYLPVRLSDGASFATLGTDYGDGSTASTVVGPAILFDNSSNHTLRAVSTATPLPVAIIAGTAAGSTDVSVHGVTVSTFVQNSSAYVAVRLTDGSAFTNYSTIAAVSSLAGFVNTFPAAPNSSQYIPVRFTDGSSFITPGSEYADGSTYSTITAPGVAFNNSSNNTFRVVGTAQPLPVQLQAAVSTLWASSAGFHFDSSGALQITGASASTQVAVSSVAGRVATAPNDTSWASSAGFHFDSSGALNIAGTFSASTTVQVSSLAGRVTTAPSDTNWASSAGFHFNSSGELNVSGAGGAGSTIVTVSTVQGIVRVAGSSLVESSLPVSVRVSDGSTWITLGTDYSDGSTASTVVGPAIFFDNSSNHTLRAVSATTPLPVSTGPISVSSVGGIVAISTGTYSISSVAGIIAAQPVKGTYSFGSTTSTLVSTASTAVYTVVSSAASTRICCYAYSITSTASAALTIEFMSSGAGNGGGSTGNIWGLDLGSQSSGITGANLAVAPPGRLFQTAAGEPLMLRLGSTNVQIRYSVSYFFES